MTIWLSGGGGTLSLSSEPRQLGVGDRLDVEHEVRRRAMQNLALLGSDSLSRKDDGGRDERTEDRRAPGATRIPFDALVEVGGALGPSFEAQAVNVSEDGMQLRTAYLPEPGQPLTCRFDARPRAERPRRRARWSGPQGADKGGEFGIRFTDIDAESVDALKRLCGIDARPRPMPSPVEAGSKVRLHIDGLASPMRAKIQDAGASEVTVGSELGFLQVGKALELEDAQSGEQAPRVHRPRRGRRSIRRRTSRSSSSPCATPTCSGAERRGRAPAAATPSGARRPGRPGGDRGSVARR